MTSSQSCLQIFANTFDLEHLSQRVGQKTITYVNGKDDTNFCLSMGPLVFFFFYQTDAYKEKSRFATASTKRRCRRMTTSCSINSSIRDWLYDTCQCKSRKGTAFRLQNELCNQCALLCNNVTNLVQPVVTNRKPDKRASMT